MEAAFGAEDIWGWLDEALTFVRGDLVGLHFETFDEAISKVYPRTTDPTEALGAGLGVARYRETDDRDNLRFFYEQALNLIGEIDQAIEARQMSPDFLRKWSMLVSCHGFVVASIMAGGDDLQSRRAGLAGGDARSLQAQRQWFSHYMLRVWTGKNLRRGAEEIVERLIHRIIDGDVDVGDWPVTWFERIVNLECEPSDPFYGRLTKTFRNLSKPKMLGLVELPHDHLPPVDLTLPT